MEKQPDGETRLLDVFCERTHDNERVFDELIATIQGQQFEQPAREKTPGQNGYEGMGKKEDAEGLGEALGKSRVNT